MGTHSNYITVEGDWTTALWIIALIITIVTLVMIIKAVKTIVEIMKSQKEESEVITTSNSSKENFFYNCIEEDIANSDIQLSNKAKNLISTYRD